MSAAAPSALLNCLRWGALGFGVFYGFNRHYALVKLEEHNRITSEIKRKEALVRKAKEIYIQKQLSALSPVVSDPTSPDFDLETFVKSLEKSK